MVTSSTIKPAGETEASTHAFVGLPVSDGVREVILVLGWLSCVVGVAGNILIMATLVTQPALRSLHNLYIGNLALADLLVVGYCVPYWLLDLGLGHHPMTNQQHCIANAFVLSVCPQASIFTLDLISFNRYMNVCHPGMYYRLFGKTSIVVSCVVVWIVAAFQGFVPLFHIDDAFYAYSNITHVCIFDGTVNPMNAFVVMAIINVLVSTILVGFFSLAIFRYWKQSRTRVNLWTQNQSEVNKPSRPTSQADMALIRSLLLVFVILIVLCVPLAAAVAVMERLHLSPDVLNVLIMLFFLNNSINWIVYGALNKNFRKGYQQLLTSGCRKPNLF